MPADSRLLAIEKTEAFMQPLRLINDDRLVAISGDALDIEQICRQQKIDSVDVVVSGIPFSAIPKKVGEEIVGAIDRILRPGGHFIAYQLRDDVVKLVSPLYGPPETEHVSLNVPPLSIHRWQKPTDAGSSDIPHVTT